jgi:hypothetical protein
MVKRRGATWASVSGYQAPLRLIKFTQFTEFPPIFLRERRNQIVK